MDPALDAGFCASTQSVFSGPFVFFVV